MNHLSPSEFIDLADGVLAPARADHAATCDRCRAQAADVRDALGMSAAAGQVPEPSPLFWEHLSARVREGLDAATPRTAFGFWRRGFQPDAALLALAVVLIAAAIVIPGLRRTGTPATMTMTPETAPVTGPDVELTLGPGDAEVWAVLTAAAQDLHMDDARDAGMSVPPAALDRAVQRLNAAELSELGRLLRSELKGSGD
jgi:hypothetical protein